MPTAKTQARLKMRQRILGRTGIKVSEIGFGGWGIGKSMWGRTDDAESLKALRAAFDLGINYFDTGLAYGRGHSEKLIARLFKEAGRKGIVSTTMRVAKRRRPSRTAARIRSSSSAARGLNPYGPSARYVCA